MSSPACRGKHKFLDPPHRLARGAFFFAETNVKSVALLQPGKRTYAQIEANRPSFAHWGLALVILGLVLELPAAMLSVFLWTQ
jgi:hypothetical protein